MRKPFESNTDPWELLERLARHARTRVRAANYLRFISLAADQPLAQQHMLVYEAQRVFHVRRHIMLLDLERSRLLAQLALRAHLASRVGTSRSSA
jgi:hypothetical protein